MMLMLFEDPLSNGIPLNPTTNQKYLDQSLFFPFRRDFRHS